MNIRTQSVYQNHLRLLSKIITFKMNRGWMSSKDVGAINQFIHKIEASGTISEKDIKAIYLIKEITKDFLHEYEMRMVSPYLFGKNIIRTLQELNSWATELTDASNL